MDILRCVEYACPDMRKITKEAEAFCAKVRQLAPEAARPHILTPAEGANMREIVKKVYVADCDMTILRNALKVCCPFMSKDAYVKCRY